MTANWHRCTSSLLPTDFTQHRLGCPASAAILRDLMGDVARLAALLCAQVGSHHRQRLLIERVYRQGATAGENLHKGYVASLLVVACRLVDAHIRHMWGLRPKWRRALRDIPSYGRSPSGCLCHPLAP